MTFDESMIQKKSRNERVIFGISLGSSTRDHVGEFNAAGYTFRLIRKGTDGSLPEAIKTIQYLDGKVDAFGLGGGVFHIRVNGDQYVFKQLLPLKAAARYTQFADGNRVKGILNDNALQAIRNQGVRLEGMKTIHMGAVDRYSQAKSLADNQCKVIFGDVMFGLGLPIPVKNLKTIEKISKVCLPVITRLPQSWFYPTGKKQDEEPSLKFRKYFDQAEMIVGDYIWIKKNLPDNLRGKIILTNTTTTKDVEDLKKRGLKLLVTTTPRIDGRSFGTNIIEAMLFALCGKPAGEVTENDLRSLICSIPVNPGVEVLN